MTPEVIGLVGLAVLALLLLLRKPVGLSLILVSFTGIYVLLGPRPAWGILTSVPYQFAAKWTLSSVPMFLLMGYVCYHGGMTRALFVAARSWLGALLDGLAIASVFGAGGFAAVTGSSVARAAAIGRIAVPKMTRAGYDPGLATGSIAAAGTLGALIPPSILLILSGFFAQVPIGDLFLGGIGAGVLTAITYAAMVYIGVRINPVLAPIREVPAGWEERFSHLHGIWPVIRDLVGHCVVRCRHRRHVRGVFHGHRSRCRGGLGLMSDRLGKWRSDVCDFAPIGERDYRPQCSVVSHRNWGQFANAISCSFRVRRINHADHPDLWRVRACVNHGHCVGLYYPWHVP
ncbi:hypothetical protein LCGC14_1434400 [marine sediment metagenome]|uniref:TRAP C4-dicarboxylate transport system permease DctM subunit domain-containing protein n=1 Tax=marine sediment metagenome TaxID=412755 RepID=A0A0F9M345_9ZZZZ